MSQNSNSSHKQCVKERERESGGSSRGCERVIGRVMVGEGGGDGGQCVC